jgi:Bacteriophage head to tail connecting protein
LAADGKAVMKRYEALRNSYATHFKLCDDMAPYFAPSRVGIGSQRTPGQSQVRSVTDSSGMAAAELMAQFIASNSINPSQQWGSMKLKPDDSTEVDDEAQEWFEDSRDRMLDDFAESMFYAEAPECLLDWGAFGTGCLITDEAPQPIHRSRAGWRGSYYEAMKTGRFVIAEEPDGLVHTVMYEKEQSAGMMETAYGKDKLPEKVKRALEAGDRDKSFTIVRAIYPRPEQERRYAAGALGMPYASCWIEKDSKEVMKESGYEEFPGAIPRYIKTPGEIMGRGRGHMAFADTWTLNEAKRMGFQDWALKLQPPILHSHDSMIATLRLTPGGPTSVNTHGRPIQDTIMPFQTGSHPEVSQIKEEELRKSIRQIFYVDQILMLMEVNKSEMTAFEFAKKMQLLFNIIGPVYGRMRKELLERIWTVKFVQMWHARAFSPPPPGMFRNGGEYATVFQNPMERAQRAGDIEATSLWIQDMLPVSQVYPQVFDVLDPDKYAAHSAAVRGVPARVTRSKDEIAALREERLQQQQAETSMAQASQMAEAGGKIAPLVTALTGAGGKT